MRPTRKPDSTRTALEAVKHKYEQGPEPNGSLHGPGYEIIEISKKKVEEVGFEKIKQQMSDFDNLRIVLIDQLNVTGLVARSGQTDIAAAQAELASTCPNISELDLGWNPIEDWNEVLDICAPLEKLRVLKASGLRFRDLKAHQQVRQVTELHLSEGLLRASDVIKLLSYGEEPVFPNLSTLWLAQNEFNAFETNGGHRGFPSVTTLVLENNHFTTLASLGSVFQAFPNLSSISLQSNRISSTGVHTATSQLSEKLTQLNLASNAINDLATIDSLPSLFPRLTSLRVSKNPLYHSLNAEAATTSASARPSDSPFYLILARLPRLTVLNYTTITPRDREEGEIYYLFVSEKEIRAKLAAAPDPGDAQLLQRLQRQYAHYTFLCAKYDRPDILHAASPAAVLEASKIPAFAAGNIKSLAGRLVNASFYLPDREETVLKRRLPRTTSVYTIKSILARHFGLPPLQFRLIYESPELDPVQVTTTKLYGSSREEWEAWGRWDVDVPPPEARGEAHSASPRMVEDEEEVWVDGEMLKGGTRWRRREVEVMDGMREWADYLDAGVQDVKARIELLEVAA